MNEPPLQTSPVAPAPLKSATPAPPAHAAVLSLEYAAPVPLEYADPDVDGVPDFLPEAEHVIDLKRNPNALRPFFRKSEQALHYFTKSMERRYSLESTALRCAACRHHRVTCVAAITWNAKVNFKFLEVSISSKIPSRTFTTHHGICRACLLQWSRRYGRRRWINMFATLGYWIGIATLIFSAFFSQTTRRGGVLSPVGILMLMSSAMIGRFTGWLIHRSVPKRIRTIVRRGVWFSSFHILPQIELAGTARHLEQDAANG